jgi:hypothetical protein
MLPGGGSLLRAIAAEPGDLDDVGGERTFRVVDTAVGNKMVEQLAFGYRKGPN